MCNVLKDVSYPHEGCIDQKYSKNNNNMEYFYKNQITVQFNVLKFIKNLFIF